MYVEDYQVFENEIDAIECQQQEPERRGIKYSDN